ncbi:ABC transporter substrate-binding protein [Burkholderia multivorans]|uniref:Polar amino acid transport system substrate-binding protein n=2 Tax=Burkholderia multivorans TaxID=87883 RepID=A0A0H3KIF9_BURM1|nr:ABC transporter substrate-binding protein [Burkholderia multivorans]ABX13814.1 extracellular solute-binding protein family 3 [Burkholderia multivorans ATCC 17616]AIO75670.1 bacterial extracellular solute-binding s, 3 family protein [Burkholderia multivorans]AOK66232.1 ABC transporter substrate-binding protein [Burkholderia multivorans]EJO58608.1 lysine-arginine-ornithine-binding periplasmic protein [Burkholderia multivorans CF2]KGC05701.1 bacterial extracellular solute-binding s, 3 family p
MKPTHCLKLAIALACALGSAAAVADAQTLRFGLEAQYPPFESKAPNGELQGFDIDVGNAVCETAKLTCKWVETSFDGLIPALKGRKFDAINSAMNATEQRRQAIDFTTIIYRVPTQLIARTGSGLLPTPESLKGKRVGVLQASIQETYAKAHWEPAGVAIVAYQDQNQAYADLVAGRLDATLVLAPAGQRGFLSRPDGKGFSFVGQPVRDDRILGSGIAFGLRKGDDALKAKLDAAIDKLKADGTVKSLGRKYFGDIDISAK